MTAAEPERGLFFGITPRRWLPIGAFEHPPLRACESIIQFKFTRFPGESRGLSFHRTSPSSLGNVLRLPQEWRRNGSRLSPGKRGEIC
jgi:hypothetical protein